MRVNAEYPVSVFAALLDDHILLPVDGVLESDVAEIPFAVGGSERQRQRHGIERQRDAGSRSVGNDGVGGHIDARRRLLVDDGGIGGGGGHEGDDAVATAAAVAAIAAAAAAVAGDGDACSEVEKQKRSSVAVGDVELLDRGRFWSWRVCWWLRRRFGRWCCSGR